MASLRTRPASRYLRHAARCGWWRSAKNTHPQQAHRRSIRTSYLLPQQVKSPFLIRPNATETQMQGGIYLSGSGGILVSAIAMLGVG